MSKRMNMVGGEGSRPQKEVFTPKSWKPVEGCGHNGCGFGDIVASRLLSISGSQFGSMHQEGKDSLPEPQCTNFAASWQMGWGFLWLGFPLACPSGISMGDRRTQWHRGVQHQSLVVAVIELRCWRMTSQGQRRKPTFEDSSSHCHYGSSSERHILTWASGRAQELLGIQGTIPRTHTTSRSQSVLPAYPSLQPILAHIIASLY